MELSKITWPIERTLTVEPVKLRGGHSVHVRELDGLGQAELDKRRYKPSAKPGEMELDFANSDAYWTCACACDKGGKLMFAWADLDAVMALPAKDLATVAASAIRLNRTDEAAVAELAKN